MRGAEKEGRGWAVCFGPGLPEPCHVADEYCPTANLPRAHEVLAGFLGVGA
jgi:acetylornithine deacetylase/succinyl-diaminopimelate desuccinylase-like protein